MNCSCALCGVRLSAGLWSTAAVRVPGEGRGRVGGQSAAVHIEMGAPQPKDVRHVALKHQLERGVGECTCVYPRIGWIYTPFSRWYLRTAQPAVLVA